MRARPRRGRRWAFGHAGDRHLEARRASSACKWQRRRSHACAPEGLARLSSSRPGVVYRVAWVRCSALCRVLCELCRGRQAFVSLPLPSGSKSEGSRLPPRQLPHRKNASCVQRKSIGDHQQRNARCCNVVLREVSDPSLLLRGERLFCGDQQLQLSDDESTTIFLRETTEHKLENTRAWRTSPSAAGAVARCLSRDTWTRDRIAPPSRP